MYSTGQGYPAKKTVFRIRIRIHMFLGLLDPDPDPSVRGMDPDPDPDLLSSCKNSKKNLDSYYFVTLFDFLSLENYVNVGYLQKVLSKKMFKQKWFFVGILKVNDEKSRIRIRIHYSESWIRGSGSTPKCHGSGTLQKNNE
jgi:hypothetical protein